jgi:hypothetical protein
MKKGKVVPLFADPNDNVVGRIEELLEMAKNGEIVGFMAAAKLKDGDVATCWANVNLRERQEMVADQQIDIMYAVVVANFEP